MISFRVRVKYINCCAVFFFFFSLSVSHRRGFVCDRKRKTVMVPISTQSYNLFVVESKRTKEEKETKFCSLPYFFLMTEMKNGSAGIRVISSSNYDERRITGWHCHGGGSWSWQQLCTFSTTSNTSVCSERIVLFWRPLPNFRCTHTQKCALSSAVSLLLTR